MKGIGASPGIAIGKAVVLEERRASVFYFPIRQEDVGAEVARLEAAVETSKTQLAELRDRVADAMGGEHAQIIDAHLLMLDDELFVGAAKQLIATDLVNAEWALKTVTAKLKKRFQGFDDPYFQERGRDVDDVGHRIQRNLQGMEGRELGEVGEDHILIARDLSPSDAALLDSRYIKGIALDEGGRTSHTGIIAKSLRIPAVVGLKQITRDVQPDDLVIIDGAEGEVLPRPSETLIREYRNKRLAHEKHERELLSLRDMPAVTADGYRIYLQANIEFPSELEAASYFGAEGIGLYRSEFLFLDRLGLPPTEDQQYEVYKTAAQSVYPSSAIVRTLDFGGGKILPNEPLLHEPNPILGLRAIRYCLKHRDVFKTQLRALLRASVHGRLKLMFPLISSVSELRQARALLEQAREELQLEGKPVAEQLSVGIMIEVPSAATVADLLAKEVDFFSIGTNDLIQFFLAIDRDNAEVSYLYQPLHPGVLRTIKFVVDSAHRNGIRVGMCGEMAADPSYTLLLVGLGLDEFSMNPVSLPLIKKIIRAIDRKHAMRVAEKALKLSTSQEINEYLLEAVVARFPHGYL